jgi:hypothetical protein
VLAAIDVFDRQALFFCLDLFGIELPHLLTIDEFDGLLDLRRSETMQSGACNASSI